MTDIKNQILAEVGKISLTTEPVSDHVFHKSALKLLLTTKETKYIMGDHEERERLYDWNPPVLFPEYNDFFHHFHEGDEVHEEDMPEKDYSDMMDGYGVSELFCDSGRWVIDPDYLKHVRLYKNTKGFLVNVYGVENHLINKYFWNFSDREPRILEFNAKKIPDYKFAEPDSVIYSRIGKPQYWDEFYIEACKDNLAVLAIDLPHSYYSNQILKGNIFTWDLRNQKYQVGGKDMDEINDMIREIAASGFVEPLVMRINEGCLTPVDNDTNIKLFIATYLGLPTIPIVLYMSNEEVMFNRYLEELHNIVHSDLWHSAAALYSINTIVMPYFYFELVGEEDTAYIKCGDTIAHKNRYPIMNTIDDDDHIHVYDRYFDTKSPNYEIHLPMTEDQIKAQKALRLGELMDDFVKRQKEEEAEILYRIQNGQY